VGGISVARGLLRDGHDVTVFERRPDALAGGGDIDLLVIGGFDSIRRLAKPPRPMKSSSKGSSNPTSKGWAKPRNRKKLASSADAHQTLWRCRQQHGHHQRRYFPGAGQGDCDAPPCFNFFGAQFFGGS
jgi:2-polyprenyl-6-methoxyphenol hydroxylase-like FAD-dependent oxidoreductase